MQNGPIRDERIVEALEACRPGSADVADPALAPLAAEMAADRVLEEVYERLQRIDARVAAAFHDVPVPEGLADRLLAALAAARAADEAVAVDSPPESGQSPRTAPAVVARLPRRVSRRWLLAASVPLAAAAGLFVVFVIGLLKPSPPKVYTGPMVMEEGLSLFLRELADPATAKHGPAGDRPKEFPFSRDLYDTDEIQWRRIDGLAGQSGVAYDIPGPRRDTPVKATLYVIRCTVEDLPDRPQPKQLQPDGPDRYSGCYVRAWQDRDRGLLYVLVYNGREDDWQHYLKQPGPLA